VNQPANNQAYGIPPDNPFADGVQGRPEIYAWGLRNPWRFSFDSLSGQLWAADVGQDLYEYVHIVELGRNYGWRTLEGSHCFDPKFGCNKEGLELPVIEYDHSVGESITGGHVYRGANYPALFGAYVYGDYASGVIFAARFVDDTDEVAVTTLVNSNLSISSFGEDQAGELYVVHYPYFTPDKGGIYRLIPQGTPTAPTSDFPLTLSDTGCFDDLTTMAPADGLIPYTVNAPLWHDGARSERYVVLPPRGKMTAKSTEPWDFPEGTRFIKTFAFDRPDGSVFRVETRFLIFEGEQLRAYSYRWNEAQTEAHLLSGAGTWSFEQDGSSFTWHYPSRSQCRSCHNDAAGWALGWRTGQLHRTGLLVGLEQLELFELLGVLESPVENPVAYPEPSDQSKPIADRTRALLQANCATCHLPNGPVTTPLDLRYETSLGEMQACNVDPEKGDLGVQGAKLIKPGVPAESTLLLRMQTLSDERMPNLGSFVVDEPAVQLVSEWITSLEGCQ
jgi:uncharacterized repeat protein (TIGR03806 family)